MDNKKIKDLIQSGEFRGPNHNGEYSANCIFCPEREGKEDHKYRLQLNPQKSVFFCYRCKASGYFDPTGLGEVEVAPSPKPDTIQIPEEFEELSDSSSWLYTAYIKYLKSRKVWEQALAVGVGACRSGRYGGRIVVPMKDSKGVWIGFSARLVVPGKYSDAPKYLYPPGMDRRGNLWGMSWINRIKSKDHPLFLVEGVFDALPLYPFGLAAFGKNVTEEQLGLLHTLSRKVIVCLDGDAWMEGKVLSQRLALRGVDSGYCRLPPGTDPGILGTAVQNYIQEEHGSL